jgi:hypothetical protein
MTDTQTFKTADAEHQTFRLYGPSGDVIMTGSMNAIMERLPDTTARNDALSTMLDTAVKQVEAEEKLEDARACAAQILVDGITRLTSRLDQFEKQRALSAKRAEAARKEAAQRQVQRYMDELPDPDDPDPDEQEPYSTDPAERAASLRDQATEGLPPPADPAGAALKDAGLEQEVTATRPTPDPADLGHVPDPKQIAPPVAASFW